MDKCIRNGIFCNIYYFFKNAIITFLVGGKSNITYYLFIMKTSSFIGRIIMSKSFILTSLSLALIFVLVFGPIPFLKPKLIEAALPANGVYGMVINEFESSIQNARVQVSCDNEGFNWQTIGWTDIIGEFDEEGITLGQDPMTLSGCQDGLPLYIRATADGYLDAAPQLVATVALVNSEETFSQWATRVLSPAVHRVFVLEESNIPADGWYGVVEDSDTGDPIIGATLTISCDTQDSTRVLATTIDEGYYEASTSEIVSQLNSLGCYYDSQFNVRIEANAEGYGQYAYIEYDVQSGDMAASFEGPIENNFWLEPNPPAIEELFAAGSGTEEDPFEIATQEQLFNINRLEYDYDGNEGLYFALANDISLEEAEEYLGYFEGVFDGQGHSIIGSDNPLFEVIHGGTVQNLFVDADVVRQDENEFGVLARQVRANARIENVHTSGTLSCERTYSSCQRYGGMVGFLSSAHIYRSSSSVEVTATGSDTYYFGGLVGSMNGSATISESYATGDITAQSGIGGLVGMLYADDGGYIMDSYATGEVHAYGNLFSLSGGLVGAIEGGSVIRSYTTSAVQGDGSGAGGLTGFFGHENTVIRSSFAASQSISLEEIAGGLVGEYNYGGEIRNSGWVMVPEVNAVGYVGDEGVACDLDAPKALLAGEGDCNFGHDFTSVNQLKKNGYNGSLAPVYLDGEDSWDFVNVWGFDEGINDGLPYLRWGVLGEEENNSGGGGSSSGGRSGSRGGGNSTDSSNQAETLSLIMQLTERIRAMVAEIVAKGGEISPELRRFLDSDNSNLSVRDLEYGMEGEDVKALQNILINQGHSIPAGVTGLFLAQTQSALSSYQSANNIVPAAGYFGSLTRAFMKSVGLTGLWW